MTLDQLMERLQAARVIRFHTAPVLERQSLASHSFNMMLIGDYAYAGAMPSEMYRAIMYHDLHELHLGDIPWPIKRNPILSETITTVTETLDQHMGLDTVDMSGHEWFTLHALDTIEFMHFLVEERYMGNRNHSAVFQRVVAEIVPQKLGLLRPSPQYDRLRSFTQALQNRWQKI